MKMKTYKNKTVKTVDKILCDSCGKDCTINVPVDEHEYAELSATWGYFSDQDGLQFDIQICETCFNEVIDFLKNKRNKVLGPFNYPYNNDPLEGKSYFPS
jgi:hypothetical protein